MSASQRQQSLVTLALLMVCIGYDGSVQAQPSRDLDQACASLSELALPQTRITRAESIHVNGAHAVPGTENGIGLSAPVQVHRSFCRVAGVVEPAIQLRSRGCRSKTGTAASRVFGLGAFWGKLPYARMAQSLDRGYAVGGTDTGHQSESDDGTWAMSDGVLNSGVVDDWAHRGIHEMTVKSQAIVESYTDGLRSTATSPAARAADIRR